MIDQPKALRLADLLDLLWLDGQTLQKAAAELRRLEAENATLRSRVGGLEKTYRAYSDTVFQVHYALKDAGWHPGRTDDLITDVIKAKGAELRRQIEVNMSLMDALSPFVLANSSEEFVTLVVRSSDITKARTAIARATGGAS